MDPRPLAPHASALARLRHAPTAAYCTAPGPLVNVRRQLRPVGAQERPPTCASIADDLNEQLPLPGPHVEVHEDDLLPRAEQQPLVAERYGD